MSDLMPVSPAPGKPMVFTLIPTAETGLEKLTERTQLSGTDIANRAIILYEFVDSQLRAGRDMISRDRVTGEALLVEFTDTPAVAPAVPAGATVSGPRHGAAGRRHPRHAIRAHLLPAASLAVVASLVGMSIL